MIFKRLADDYGMKLLYKKPFAEFFSENAEKGEYRSLLNKMQGLEVRKFIFLYPYTILLVIFLLEHLVVFFRLF